MSFSLILIWGARLPVVSRNPYGFGYEMVKPFLLKPTPETGSRRAHSRSIRQTEEQCNRKGWGSLRHGFPVGRGTCFGFILLFKFAGLTNTEVTT